MTRKTAPAPTLSRRSALILAVGTVGASALGLRAFLRRPDPDRQTVTPAEAHRLARTGAAVLVDIRQPEEWQITGVGDGAVPIDMRRADFIAALQAAAGPDPAAPVVLICAAGVRSAYLTRRLTEAGFTNIIDVPEGMTGSAAGPGWIAAGLPVTRVAPAG